MSISLYHIEAALQQLVDLREQAEAEGDSEALKVIDQQLREYLTKEAAKVTSYMGLIRSREATARQCNDEIERLQNIRAAAVGDIDRLKANALAVMQQFGVRELKATPGGGLRIQNNGGVQALDVPEVEVLPIEYRNVAVTMRGVQWQALLKAADIDRVEGIAIEVQPDTERIREALAQRVPCPECSRMENRGEAPGGECPRCKGVGTIPNTVPGAKLLERGEHIRVL